MKTFVRTFGLIFGLLALVILAAGCGVDHSPVAPAADSAQLTAEEGDLALESTPPEPAAKKAAESETADSGSTKDKNKGSEVTKKKGPSRYSPGGGD